MGGPYTLRIPCSSLVRAFVNGASSPRQVVNNGAIFILSRTVVKCASTPSSLRGRGSRGSSVCD